MNSTVLFPHISRLFTALPWVGTGKLALWGALVGLFGVNLYLQANTATLRWNELFPVFRRPFDASAHAALASAFLNQGFVDSAQREFDLARDLMKTSVLGTNTENTEETAIRRHKADFAFWQKVIQKRPDYRDAYIQAAWLGLYLGEVNKARTLAQQALQLDPSAPTISKLLLLLDTDTKK